jgi:hypothetical protein
MIGLEQQGLWQKVGEGYMGPRCLVCRKRSVRIRIDGQRRARIRFAVDQESNGDPQFADLKYICSAVCQFRRIRVSIDRIAHRAENSGQPLCGVCVQSSELDAPFGNLEVCREWTGFWFSGTRDGGQPKNMVFFCPLKNRIWVHPDASVADKIWDAQRLRGITR